MNREIEITLVYEQMNEATIGKLINKLLMTPVKLDDLSNNFFTTTSGQVATEKWFANMLTHSIIFLWIYTFLLFQNASIQSEYKCIQLKCGIIFFLLITVTPYVIYFKLQNKETYIFKRHESINSKWTKTLKLHFNNNFR